MIPIYFLGQFSGVILGIVAAIYINDVAFIPILPDQTDLVSLIR